MVGGRLPKALTKNPKPFVDVSSGLMNVPDSVSRMRADGVIDPVARSEGLKPNRVVKRALSTKRPKTFISRRNGKNGKKGFRQGRAEGRRLTKVSSKRASRTRL